MTNSNINNQTSSDDIAIIEGEVINTNINEQTTSSSTPLTVLGNPSNLIVPENPKDCFPFIAVCDGILRTAGNMLKQLNIMRISWQYAILRLKAQHNLGKYFSTIEGSQGIASDSGKEKILKEQYGISVKRGWQHEQLYKHKDLMQKTIKRAKSEDDLPTLRLTMTIYEEEKKKASDEAKENQKNQAKHEDNQQKLREKAIKDAIKFQKLHRTDTTVLDDETFNVIYADPLSINIPMTSLKGIDIRAIRFC